MSRLDPAKMSPAAVAVLNYDVNTVARMLEQKYPTVWNRVFTKSIDAPNHYYSSRSLAVGLTGALVEAKVSNGALDSNVPLIAGTLEQYDFPVYYVSAPLMDALKRSHPPANLKWSDIMLPFPALTFMLPRGSLQEPKEYGGNDIIWVGVCRFNQGEHPRIPGRGPLSLPMPANRISVCWGLAPSGLTMNDSTFPLDQPLEPDASWIDRVTEEGNRVYFGPKGNFSAIMAGLVANFILVMEARKELVEPGICRLKSRGPGKPSLHSPTFIGRNYTILRKGPPGDARGHFTELGWRAGHFKRQHYGPKREQVKTIWIDPYIAMVRGLEPVGVSK